uniref:Uncharacterized protein n=1 Tax=Timema shepardi TaxID=629360 RepID=A0A7R9ANS4_TIMSH|nr:unnamed protein product [Timema shepardi]
MWPAKWLANALVVLSSTAEDGEIEETLNKSNNLDLSHFNVHFEGQSARSDLRRENPSSFTLIAPLNSGNATYAAVNRLTTVRLIRTGGNADKCVSLVLYGFLTMERFSIRIPTI